MDATVWIDNKCRVRDWRRVNSTPSNQKRPIPHGLHGNNGVNAPPPVLAAYDKGMTASLQ